MFKRIVSILLVLCMVLTLMPAQALAAVTSPKASPNTASDHPFTDVKEGQWYYDAVLYAYENGLFNGTGATTFSPGGTMTRAMSITVLGRMVGVDISKYSSAPAFSDVPANAYYAPYVAWATEMGITSGIGSGKFDPDGLVTRQQMATFIVRLFYTYGYTYPEATVTGVPKDKDSIASYARDAVLKLWACGMFVGNNGKFNPNNNATRAEAATFLMRTDNHLVETGHKQNPDHGPGKENPTAPGGNNGGGNNGGGSNGGGDNVSTFTVSFNTMGGSAISSKVLPSGTKLNNLPTPYKINEIFQGWYYDAERTKPVSAQDALKSNITLYAGYMSADMVTEQATSPFASALDVCRSFTIAITDDSSSMSANEVKAALSYTCLTDPEFTDIIVSGSNGNFTVTGNGGWQAGSTNKLELLDDRLHFVGFDPTADIYNFTVEKAEVMNLQLNSGIKYLPADSISNITQDGADVYGLSIPLATVKAGRSSSVQIGTTTGTFTYKAAGNKSMLSSSEEIMVGDIVAIYEGTRPDQRMINTDDDNYADEDVAYVIITAIDGDKYTYKNADSTDVMFTPDVLPVSDTADQVIYDGNVLTVSKSIFDFTDEKYNGSGLDATTTIDVGDFIAFYPGGQDPSDKGTSVSAYAQITAVETDGESYVISYKNATIDDIIAAMDIYDTTYIDGEMLLGDTDVKSLEQSIAKQARESGFADEAAQYLAVLAMETDGFKKLAGEMSLFAAEKPKVENLELIPDIRTQLRHFEGLSGLRAALTLSFDVIVPAGEKKIVIHVEGTFEEEARLSVNVGGGAVWKWAWIFPYIADYRLNSNIDVYNFTGISINAKIGTFEKDETPDLDEDDDWDNVAMQLKELLEKAETGKEIIEGIDTMGTTLAEKYSAMLENESDWVELFTVNLFDLRGFVDPLHILCYGVGADFVVSANMNITLGLDFFYENAKRYNFSLGLFSKTSESDTVTLVEEKYEFTFYVMGSLGVRAGLRLEVIVGLFSLELDSVGVSAEVGAYFRLWGYFYYRLTWTESAGKETEATGALLIEVGIYLDVKFMAQAFNGHFSYNPTLYENEWPLFSAGKRDNIQDFSYDQENAPKVEMKKKVYKTVLPDSVFSMSYLDLKDGKTYDKSYNDETDFDITISNPAFSYDPTTNTVTVTPGFDLSKSGEMVITWKGQPISFSSKSMSRTISLSWEDLEGAFVIDFNSNGGNSIKPIVARPGTSISSLIPENPTKQGYVFGGWYKDEALTQAYVIPAIMGDSDVSLYAKWNPATNVKYTVNHYQQNLSNEKQYTLADTDVMTNGVTDSVITPAVKEYVGFTSPAAKSLTILPDGSAVMNYYYTRNTYIIIFSRNGIDENEDLTYQYKYGASVSAPKIATAGYFFDKWDKAVVETMPANNLVYTASWIPDPNTPFRVEYYLQNTLENTYVLTNIKSLSGETNTLIDVSSHIQAIEGMTYARTVILNTETSAPRINKNGTTIIKLYYDRNKYDLELYVDGALLRTDKVAYGATLLEPGKPTRQGYVFDGWYQDAAMTVKYTFGHTMTTEVVKVYGKFIPAANTGYTVMHYVEQLNGEYSYQKTDEKTGTTEETLTLAQLADSALIINGGISYKEAKVNDETVTTAKILADGSLVIKLYYQRESHTLTFIPNNGGENITRTGKYESVVVPPTVTKTGYTFAGWSPAVPAAMPAADATFTALWTASTNTPYRVEHYWQNANGIGYEIHETTFHSGTTEQTVMAEPKSYVNFILNEAAQGSIKEGTITADGTLVLKLYYDRAQFEITFDPNGGTLLGGSKQTLPHGATVTTTAPARTGYGFGGWYLDQECTVAFNGTMPAENVTVYARWMAGEVSYTVRHYVMDVNGNYPSIETPTATINQTAITGTELTLEGQRDKDLEVLNGIFYKEARVGNIVAETVTVLADGSLIVDMYYARRTYTLTWDLDGGTKTSDGTAEGEVYYDAPLTAPQVSKSGYLQNGWSPTFTGKMPAQNITYKVQWSNANYTITYQDVGGASFSGIHGATHPTSHTYGAATALVSPTKANYNFVGWFTDINGSGDSVTVLAATHTGNVTLYAKWAPMSFSITYSLNGGTNAAGNPETYTYGTVVNLENPTKTGYSFVGWYSNAALTAQVTNPVISASDSGNKTFYAKWTIINYNIVYDINVDGVTNSNPITYSIESNTIILNTPTKNYYIFDGWFLDEAYTQPITQIEKGSTGNLTIYGKMTEVGKEIEYQLDAGVVNHESNPRYYRINDGKVYLQAPTRPGYDFVRWELRTSTSTSPTPVEYLEFATYPNLIRLTAVWQPKEIRITYNDFSAADVDRALPATMTYGQSVALPTRIYSLPDGAYKDKQFLGVYATADFSGDPITVLKDFTEDTVLYVKWADGSESNPYLLRDENDLINPNSVLMLQAGNGKFFEIEETIYTTYTYKKSTINVINDGIFGTLFNGTFKPGDKKVSMILNVSQLSPLFNTISGTLRNFDVYVNFSTAIHLSEQADPRYINFGFIASKTESSALIENCSVRSSLNVSFSVSNGEVPWSHQHCYFGSIVGANYGVINNVSTELTIRAGSITAANNGGKGYANGMFSVGGIAGYSNGGEIRNSSVSITNSAYSMPEFNGYFGGIVGYAEGNLKIYNCTVLDENTPNPVISTIECQENGYNITQSSGLIAGYVSYGTIIGANLRLNSSATYSKTGDYRPLVGILGYSGSLALDYLYISYLNNVTIEDKKMLTYPTDYSFTNTLIRYIASVKSTNLFPTDKYLVKLDGRNNSYVPNDTTLVKDAMNAWVNNQNNWYPGKYKTW